MTLTSFLKPPNASCLKQTPQRVVFLCNYGNMSGVHADWFRTFLYENKLDRLVECDNAGLELEDRAEKLFGAHHLVPIRKPALLHTSPEELHKLMTAGQALHDLATENGKNYLDQVPKWPEKLATKILGVNWRRLARKSGSNDRRR